MMMFRSSRIVQQAPPGVSRRWNHRRHGRLQPDNATSSSRRAGVEGGGVRTVATTTVTNQSHVVYKWWSRREGAVDVLNHHHRHYHCRRLYCRRGLSHYVAAPAPAAAPAAPVTERDGALRAPALPPYYDKRNATTIYLPVGHRQIGKVDAKEHMIQKVPLTIADLHLRDEQLPFGYFFQKHLDEKELLDSLQETLINNYALVGGQISDNGTCIEYNSTTDTIPVSFQTLPCTVEEWRSLQNNSGHEHAAGGSGDQHHPALLNIFDSLFPNNNSNSNEDDGRGNDDADDLLDDDYGRGRSRYSNLLSVRVTYFACGGTCLGVTTNHCLADTASCIRLVEQWGQTMRRRKRIMQKKNENNSDDNDKTGYRPLPSLLSSSLVCWDRAAASTTGMMTTDLADLLGIVTTTITKKQRHSEVVSILLKWLDKMVSFWSPEPVSPADPIVKSIVPIRHEYVPLHFSPNVLAAMKAHGMQSATTTNKDSASYVSTNDMVTAAGWLMKRSLSKNPSWNLAMILNLRGRGGVKDFSDHQVGKTDSNNHTGTRSGLFGNAITSIVAKVPSSTSLDMAHVSAAAQSIRLALIEGALEIPLRIMESQMGRSLSDTNTTTPSTMDTFSTTSWGQLSPFDKNKILFMDDTPLMAFHGQPAYPLPPGRTFASVIHSNADGQSCTYEMFVPSDQADEVRRLHAGLCARFVDWYKK